MAIYRKKTLIRRKPAYKKGVSKATSKAITKVVNRTFAKKTETKEYQVHINENTLSNFSTQGYFVTLNGIAQGAGSAQRIGCQINEIGLQVKGMIVNNSVNATFARMIIFRANNQQAMTSSTEFLLGQSGVPTTVGTQFGLNAMYWPLNKKQVTVYSDQIMRFGSNTSIDGSHIKNFSKFIKLHGKKVNYDGNGTDDANQTSTLQICWITARADDDDVAETTMEVSALCRLWYKDS